MFGFNKRTSKPEPKARIGPLGVTVGGSFAVDLFAHKLNPSAWQFAGGDGTQMLVARGYADLGDGAELLRYYTDDDWFLQFLMDRDSEVPREITLYQPFDSVVLQSPAAWQQWTGPSGWMRAPKFELDDGTVYDRLWFPDEPGAAELVEFEEDIYLDREERHDRRIHQACMLYHRPVDPAIDASEYLLIGKESGDDGQSIELMVGIDVAPDQLTVF